MNILYILQYFPVYGGGETVTVKIANELIRRGHKVFVAYTIDHYSDPMPYEVDDRMVKKKIDHVTVPYSKEDVASLRQFIVENKIDIAINQWADKKFCHLATRGTGCKLIMCWHISTFYPVIPRSAAERMVYHISQSLWTYWQHWKQLRCHKENLKYNDKYVFLTPQAADELYREYPFDKEKVTSIPNPATYADWLPKDQLGHKKKKVLFVGRMLEYHKRMSFLLDAWKVLSGQIPLDEWELLLLGDGPDREMVEKKISDEAIPNCRMLGFHVPKPYYEECSLLLLTSYIEGWGMVIVEAMQNGVVPIVTDSFSAVWSIITPDKDGIIVPNNDVNAYANAIKSLIIDEGKRQQMACNALASSEQFRVENVAQQWIELFNEMTNKNR